MSELEPHFVGDRHEKLDIRACRFSYLKAISVLEDQNVGVDDALAYVLMKKRAIQPVYSFDKDFDTFADIRRTIE